MLTWEKMCEGFSSICRQEKEAAADNAVSVYGQAHCMADGTCVLLELSYPVKMVPDGWTVHYFSTERGE